MGVFVMPMLGADMKAGELISWLKKPGDAIHKGDLIAEVDTEKAAVEVEVFVDGVIERLLAAPGQKLPVGAPMAVIREPGEAGPITLPPTPGPPTLAAPPVVRARALPPSRVTPVGFPARVKVSPSARGLAEELAVDLSGVTGSGPSGRVMRRDVERQRRPRGQRRRRRRRIGRCGCARQSPPRWPARTGRYPTSTSAAPST